MKKSQLKKIVKEEVKKVVKEEERYTMANLDRDWAKRDQETPKKLSFNEFIRAASGTLHRRGQTSQIQDELLKHIYSVDYKKIKGDIMKKFGVDENGEATF